MRQTITLLALCFLSASAFAAERPTRIHIVRHGETVANKTGVYNSKNLNVFSEGGEEQVRQLTGMLAGLPRFDVVGVSPVPRAMNTLKPYLQETGVRAEVWPSLAECCHQKDKTIDPAAKLPVGRAIQIPAADAKLFVANPPGRWYEPGTYAEGMKQVEEAAREVRQRFAGKGTSVLLVGHGINGSLLIALLLGRPPTLAVRLENGKMTVLEETDHGKFRLVQHNTSSPKVAAPAR